MTKSSHVFAISLMYSTILNLSNQPHENVKLLQIVPIYLRNLYTKGGNTL